MTKPTIQRGAFSFLSGRSYAIGRFQDRDVAIRLQLKRNRYGQGYLVVAVRTGGQPALNYDGIDARAALVGFGPTQDSASSADNPVKQPMPLADSVVVLVVDDEPPVREFLRRWLQAWDYAVKEAGNATEALEVMLAERASIMLCDIRMPGHDGLWLAERVREKWPQTAIIMATALDDLPTVLKSRQLGAVDYITKPFGRELLRQALNRALAALASQHVSAEQP